MEKEFCHEIEEAFLRQTFPDRPDVRFSAASLERRRQRLLRFREQL
jgi:hypothetical protein